MVASRIAKGGRGRRRPQGDTTLTGRARSAHRWSTAAAVVASKQQHLLLAFTRATSLREVMQKAIACEAGVDAFIAGSVVRAAPRHVRQLIRCVLMDHSAKVAAAPAKLQYQATQITERLRAHAGAPGRVRDVAPPAVQRAPREPGWWLDRPGDQVVKQPRPPPPPHGRMLTGLANWDVGRLGRLPDHAVVCFERAEGRVAKWRADNDQEADAPPPERLLTALIFIHSYPTLIASEADHFWLIALGRWATATETMRLFQVPEGSGAWNALLGSAFTSRQLVATLGRAVHVGAAKQAFEMTASAPRADPSQPPRYASACSGIDLMAVAFGEALGAPFVHTGASELDADVRRALIDIHAPSGLTENSVLSDATDRTAVESAAPADVWSVTPPCESLSRRNHSRSEEDMVDAARDLDKMLHFPRTHRPGAIVVENVNEPEARSVIDAALLSLPGYEWVTFESDAQALGEMARERRFWVGTRA